MISINNVYAFYILTFIFLINSYYMTCDRYIYLCVDTDLLIYVFPVHLIQDNTNSKRKKFAI